MLVVVVVVVVAVVIVAVVVVVAAVVVVVVVAAVVVAVVIVAVVVVVVAAVVVAAGVVVVVVVGPYRVFDGGVFAYRCPKSLAGAAFSALSATNLPGRPDAFFAANLRRGPVCPLPEKSNVKRNMFID